MSLRVCMFRWRGFQPHHLSAGPYIDSFCMFSAQILICLRLPSSSHQDTGLRALHPLPAARAPPSCHQGLALGGAEPGWGARGQRGPNRVGWRSATHTLNFARLWRGGVSRGVIWRPSASPAVGGNVCGQDGSLPRPCNHCPALRRLQ